MAIMQKFMKPAKQTMLPRSAFSAFVFCLTLKSRKLHFTKSSCTSEHQRHFKMGPKILAVTFLFVMAFCRSSDAQASCACTQCPAQPLDRCDFYFTGELYPVAQFGNSTEVPVFQLDTGVGDHAIGTPILDSRSVSFVEIDRAGNASFLCASGNCLAGEQFYATIFQGMTYVMVRTFNQPSLAYFENRCVLLPLYSVQIVLSSGEVINLNPGDNNLLYPEDRRCLVFRTGPSPPQPGNCCNSTIPAPPQSPEAGLLNPPPPFTPPSPRAASLRPPSAPIPESVPPPSSAQSPSSPPKAPPAPITTAVPVPSPPPTTSTTPSFQPRLSASPPPSSPLPSTPPTATTISPPPAGPQASIPLTTSTSPPSTPPLLSPPFTLLLSSPPPSPTASLTPLSLSSQPPSPTASPTPPSLSSQPPSPTASPTPPSLSSQPPSPTASPLPPTPSSIGSPGSPPPPSSPPPPGRLILPNAPPPPPTPTLPCVTVCPASPTAFCDFYFSGFENSVPAFSLEQNTSIDEVISGSSSLAGITVTSLNLEVDATNSKIQVLSCPQPTATEAIESQFYIVGSPAKLHARTFQSIPGVQYFENRCYLLPITDFALIVNGTTINLSPGDNNVNYPESSRCVVFTSKA